MQAYPVFKRQDEAVGAILEAPGKHWRRVLGKVGDTEAHNALKARELQPKNPRRPVAENETPLSSQTE